MTSRRVAAWVGALVVGVSLLAACSSSGSSAKGASSSPDTLTVLAGSELKDMQPILDAAKKATGVKVVFQYTGSLAGADQIASGTPADAAWFASDKYIALAGANAKVLERRNTMLTPVIIGVKQSVAKRLGWQPDTVTWKDIAQAAANGQFKFAMTSPTASNSGFSALVGVADALANGQPLTASTIDAAGLQGFFKGQAVTSGSSGFLVDTYTKNQGTLDGIVNYESVLLGMNASNTLQEPLTLLYPKEGIVTAQYPLMLLNEEKRAAFDKLETYLTQPDVQREIQSQTARRAVTPGVPPDPRLSHSVLIEANFPANLQVVQALLEDYQSNLRRPASTIYVLDTSGSMQGERLDRLKQAMDGLAGGDTSFSGHFSRFNPREKVTLVVFNDTIVDTKTFNVTSSDPSSPALRQLRSYVDGLYANGGTAIYSALDTAYQKASEQLQADPNAYTSIVLLTDGENNAGINPNDFVARLQSLPPELKNVHVFPVLFGEADPDALQQVAAATGGQRFDARSADLSQVFKDIRGYQ
jgi:Ca-activated chloride channel family protein